MLFDCGSTSFRHTRNPDAYSYHTDVVRGECLLSIDPLPSYVIIAVLKKKNPTLKSFTGRNFEGRTLQFFVHISQIFELFQKKAEKLSRKKKTGIKTIFYYLLHLCTKFQSPRSNNEKKIWKRAPSPPHPPTNPPPLPPNPGQLNKSQWDIFTIISMRHILQNYDEINSYLKLR